MQVSGGKYRSCVELPDGFPRPPHEVMGSLRAPIGQLHDLTLNGTRFVIDRTQRRF